MARRCHSKPSEGASYRPSACSFKASSSRPSIPQASGNAHCDGPYASGTSCNPPPPKELRPLPFENSGAPVSAATTITVQLMKASPIGPRRFSRSRNAVAPSLIIGVPFPRRMCPYLPGLPRALPHACQTGLAAASNAGAAGPPLVRERCTPREGPIPPKRECHATRPADASTPLVSVSFPSPSSFTSLTYPIIGDSADLNNQSAAQSLEHRRQTGPVARPDAPSKIPQVALLSSWAKMAIGRCAPWVVNSPQSKSPFS